jgi:hypothetical protein
VNAWDLILLAALLAAVLLAIRSIRRGKGSCGCGCSGCAHAAECRKKKE